MTCDVLDEYWTALEEFPGYSVSNRGRVRNDRTDQILRISYSTNGCPMVGLMKDRHQRKRSLSQLVAGAYLPPPPNEAFDTPIHLDGDRDNCEVSNLMWRPLWHARKYMRQFTDNHTTCDVPIEDVETGERYNNSMHAAVVNGLLDSEIIISMHENGYVWPTGQVFRKVDSR